MNSILTRYFVLMYVPFFPTYFFILNVFDSGHVEYLQKKSIHFCFKTFDQNDLWKSNSISI